MKIPASVTRKLARQVLIAKKNSPHIFFAAGVAGVITSTVLACRATTKLDKELDNIKHDMNSIKDLKKDLDEGKTDQYSVEQYRQDAMYVYGKSVSTVAKLYAPAVIVGGISITLLAGSHVQLTRRNSALMAAYTAVHNAYNNYRQRVRDQFGIDRELDIYHGTKTEVIEVEEAGKMKEIEIKTVNRGAWSPYAQFFDENNPNWVKNADLNRMFIEAQQRWANQRLHFKGHVFLNEVYDLLGIDRTKEGAVVGWLREENGGEDGYITFGVYEAWNERFVNGMERSAVLDFNVDGIIYDKI